MLAKQDGDDPAAQTAQQDARRDLIEAVVAHRWSPGVDVVGGFYRRTSCIRFRNAGLTPLIKSCRCLSRCGVKRQAPQRARS